MIHECKKQNMALFQRSAHARCTAHGHSLLCQSLRTRCIYNDIHLSLSLVSSVVLKDIDQSKRFSRYFDRK